MPRWMTMPLFFGRIQADSTSHHLLNLVPLGVPQKHKFPPSLRPFSTVAPWYYFAINPRAPQHAYVRSAKKIPNVPKSTLRIVCVTYVWLCIASFLDWGIFWIFCALPLLFTWMHIQTSPAPRFCTSVSINTLDLIHGSTPIIVIAVSSQPSFNSV